MQCPTQQRPRALVVRTAGINRDGELLRAFTLAGADAEAVHLDRLIAEPDRIDQYAIIGFPGGFSYGDDVASGRIMAMHARERLWDRFSGAVERGALVIGVCNGFQVLVQMGLLPGPIGKSPVQRVALTENTGARFVNKWVRMIPEPGSKCVWTRGLEEAVEPELLMFPSAHGEGRFVADSPETLDELEAGGQVALRYEENFNGSARSIAGICDPSGRVFGLMPHPEDFVHWNRHPWWTRLTELERSGPPPGLRLFQNAVEAASNPVGARA